MDWNTFTANADARYLKKAKVWRLFYSRTTKLAALADPATGGSESLCHNWGNEESRRIWRDSWRRWKFYDDECQRRFKADWRAACAFEKAKREGKRAA